MATWPTPPRGLGRTRALAPGEADSRSDEFAALIGHELLDHLAPCESTGSAEPSPSAETMDSSTTICPDRLDTSPKSPAQAHMVHPMPCISSAARTPAIQRTPP